MILTDEELIQACQYYSAILRIQDWNIKIKLVDRETIEDNDGRVKINAYYKRATIMLPTSESMPVCDHHPYNMLESLLHEMVHVVFFMANPKMEKNTLDYCLWESSVDRMAGLIMEGFPNWKQEESDAEVPFKKSYADSVQTVIEMTHVRFTAMTGLQSSNDDIGKIKMVNWDLIKNTSLESNIIRIVRKDEDAELDAEVRQS